MDKNINLRLVKYKRKVKGIKKAKTYQMYFKNGLYEKLNFRLLKIKDHI